MAPNVTDQINSEIEAMSPDQLRQALIAHLAKETARKASYNTPAAKARRKEYYNAKKNTPEWKEARARQAEARKAKGDALIAMAKARFTPQELAELGLTR